MPSSNAKKRRDVLELIASGKRHLTWLHGIWSVRGTVYQPHPDGPSKSGEHRPRREDEYPENTPRDWAATAVQVDKILFELTILRDLAEANATGYADAIRNHRNSLNRKD